MHFLIAYCNWIRILCRHKQCYQILVFIEILSDLEFIWNKKESVSQDLWHSKPWEIQCQCRHTNLLVYKIWHSLIYSQRGQIRYFFILTRNIWECFCAAPSAGCKQAELLYNSVGNSLLRKTNDFTEYLLLKCLQCVILKTTEQTEIRDK